MKGSSPWLSWLSPPGLTRTRMALALAVALGTDAAQFFFGPVGWVLVDQALDVIAMVLTCWALGFHPLLLPTFIIEFIPVADMLPSWTGCTVAVIALRRRASASAGPAAPGAGRAASVSAPVIDIPGKPERKPD